MTANKKLNNNKNFSRILLVGEIGSGKTSLIASLIGAINETENYFLRSCMSNNNDEKRIFMELKDAITEGRFPERDYSIKNSKPSQTIGFEFDEHSSKINRKIEIVDMAGHFCRYIGMSTNVKQTLLNEINTADLCLIVVDHERAADDTEFIREFLNLYENCSTPALLIVTKTDKIGTGKMDADTLLRKLPLFYHYLPSNYGIEILPYSLGKVLKTEEGYVLRKFDTSFAINLLDRIIERMNVKLIPKKNLRQKILNFFKAAAM